MCLDRLRVRLPDRVEATKPHLRDWWADPIWNPQNEFYCVVSIQDYCYPSGVLLNMWDPVPQYRIQDKYNSKYDSACSERGDEGTKGQSTGAMGDFGRLIHGWICVHWEQAGHLLYLMRRNPF